MGTWPQSRAYVEITLIASIILAFDQLTKAWMQAWLGAAEGPSRREVPGGTLAFEYVENRGAAFGLFAGQTWILTIGAALVAIGFIGVFRREANDSLFVRLGLAGVIGGAIGNLMDRVVRGFVVDFIAIGSWPKFNAADTAITVGIALLLLYLVRESQPERLA